MGCSSDQRGFSLIETLAGLLLIGVAAVALISVLSVMSMGTHTATMSAEDTDLRAAVVQALSHGATCPNSIIPAKGSSFPPGAGLVPVSIVDKSVPGSPMVVSDGENIKGVVYNVSLQYPSHFVNLGFDATFPAGNGRATSTTRYLGEIVLKANRNPSAHLGSPSTTSYVPVFFELNSSNKIASCSTTPGDEDEPLYYPPPPYAGNPPTQHTVRDCVIAGGVPYPTDIGLLCRFPVFVRNTGTSTGPIKPTPSCSGTFTEPSGKTVPWIPVAGWNDPPDGVYTSTRATDFHYTACTNKSMFTDTGYHELGPYPIEFQTFTQQSGTGNNINWAEQAAGLSLAASAATLSYAASMGFAILGVGTAFGPAGLMVAGVIFIIFSFSKKGCHSDPPTTVYAQPIALGCY